MKNKKKTVFAAALLAVSLTAVFIIILIIRSAGSDNPTNIEDFHYEINGSEITITGYSGIDSRIVIPKKIDGKRVTAIKENAFYGFSFLESVVIPDGITVIDGAFKECPDLVRVEIGKDVVSAKRAFINCRKLSEAEGGEGLTRIDEAFKNCSALKEYEFPSGITNADNAFDGCVSLETVSISSGISSLNGTFAGCCSLKKIFIPETVTELISAFRGCSSLTEVTGGASVSVYRESFSGCSLLSEITLSGNIKEFSSVFNGCSLLERVINLPSSVEIYSPSFNYCTSITNIVIPKITDSSALESYSPEDDFLGCVSLRSLSILADLTDCGSFANVFEGLSSLEELVIPESVLTSLLKVTYTVTDLALVPLRLTTDNTNEENDGTEPPTGAIPTLESFVTDEKELDRMYDTIKKFRKIVTVRVTDNYSVIDGVPYTHIYGSEIGYTDVDLILSEQNVIGFEPFDVSFYWCGYPSGTNRTDHTIAVRRTFSFQLCTTGKNDGTLPDSITVNGYSCIVSK